MDSSAWSYWIHARHGGDEGARVRWPPLPALPEAAALPRAFRRTPDLARDMAECLLTAHRHGAHLTAGDAYWLTVLRRRYLRGEVTGGPVSGGRWRYPGGAGRPPASERERSGGDDERTGR